MAKARSVKIKLVSTAGTGIFYTTKKSSKALSKRIEKRKYDPVIRRHVVFTEAKIK